MVWFFLVCYFPMTVVVLQALFIGYQHQRLVRVTNEYIELLIKTRSHPEST